jgi:hypothetical protein
VKTDKELIIQGLKTENLKLNSNAKDVIFQLYRNNTPLTLVSSIELLYNIMVEYHENERRIDD